jgi:hypothetical protein
LDHSLSSLSVHFSILVPSITSPVPDTIYHNSKP